MAIFNDHHLHTKHSRCCHEDYDLEAVARLLESKGFDYACVTDHVHFQADGRFVHEHVAMRDQLVKHGFPLWIYIGIEASIIDMDGHLPLDTVGTVGTPLLDFLVAGDHWIPGTSITMDDLPAGRQQLARMHESDSSKLAALYKDIATMYARAVSRNDISVLVHPFDTLLRMTDFDVAILEAFEPVCEACQDRGVAIELNSAAARRYFKVYDKIEPLHQDCIPPGEFYVALLKVAARYDVTFSACSDAHATRDVGELEDAIKLASLAGIGASRIWRLPPRQS